MGKVWEIFEDNEDPVQANRCKLAFKNASQRTGNHLKKSQLCFSQLSDFCDCGFESMADVRQVRLQGSRRIWIPFILFPRIEGKSSISLRPCGLWLLRFLCR